MKKYQKKTNVPGRTRGLHIIDDFISRELFTNLSWTGIRHSPTSPAKHQFSHLTNITQCLYEICWASDDNFKRDDVEKFLQSLMHNATSRLKTEQKGTTRRPVSRKSTKRHKKAHPPPDDDENSHPDASNETNNQANA